jgi:hypothetical protein
MNPEAPKPKRKRNKHPTSHTPGKPRFIPSAEQRAMVAALVSMKMPWAEIIALIPNPYTDAPIGRACFARVFKTELREGSPRLKALIATKYYAALSKGEAWAIKLGLRNRFRWALESGGEPDLTFDGGTAEAIEVRFVLPSPKPQDQIVDVTPQPEAKPDYTLPAIEGPQPRARTPFGAMWEQPSKDGWMK